MTGTGENSFLEFTVNSTSLQNANAIVAVKDKDGTVMWSWHLWFTPKSSLDKITYTNDGKAYQFIADNLGWKYTNGGAVQSYVK